MGLSLVAVPLVIALLANYSFASDRGCIKGYIKTDFLRCKLDCTKKLNSAFMCDSLDYFLTPAHADRYPILETDATQCEPAGPDFDSYEKVNDTCWKMCQKQYKFVAPNLCKFQCSKELDEKGVCDDSYRLNYRINIEKVASIPITSLKNNVAKNKPSKQSSFYKDTWVSSNAVDGKTNGIMDGGSCIHTDFEAAPWWETNLGTAHRVSTVRVWNREDCCSERLDGFMVTVDGVVFGPNYNTAPPPGGFLDVVGDITGKTVRIQGTQLNALHFCEVQIEGVPVANVVPTNAACGKPSKQSSTKFGGTAEKANDCNMNTLFWKNSLNMKSQQPLSCSHTNTEENPWWEVDLETTKFISAVRIWNRKDCCFNEIDGFEVLVDDKVCSQVGNTAPPAGTAREVKCGLSGSKVKVVLPRKGMLIMCEVQVLAMENDHQSTITGTLTSGEELDSIAIVNATVVLVSKGGLTTKVKTDGNGNFNVKVPPNTYTVKAITVNSLVPQTPVKGVTTITVKQDETKDIQFLFHSMTGRLAGRVLKFFRRKGKVLFQPIPNIVVRFLSKNATHLVSTATTGKDGRFLADVPVDNYAVAPIVGPGMASIGKSQPVIKLVVQPGSLHNRLQFNFTIAPSQPGSITGVIFSDLDGSGNSEHGRPVPKANITITSFSEKDIILETNKFGEFRSDVPPGKYVIHVKTPHNQTFLHGDDTMKVVVYPGKNADVEVPLQPLIKVNATENPTRRFQPAQCAAVEVKYVQLWGIIFEDKDDNGHINQGDYALPGVPVSLYSEKNVSHSLENVLTDEKGDFHFFKAAKGNNYTIIITPPDGLRIHKADNKAVISALTVSLSTEGPPTMLQVALIAKKNTIGIASFDLGIENHPENEITSNCGFCDPNAQCIENRCVCKSGFKGTGLICRANTFRGKKPSKQMLEDFIKRFKQMNKNKWDNWDD